MDLKTFKALEAQAIPFPWVKKEDEDEEEMYGRWLTVGPCLLDADKPEEVATGDLVFALRGAAPELAQWWHARHKLADTNKKGDAAAIAKAVQAEAKAFRAFEERMVALG